MIQEAAERLVAEQQKTEHLSILRRLGKRCNRTLKVMLAIPSSPDVKTYSTTRPRSPPRQMALPYGAITSALSSQGRMQAGVDTHTTPGTATIHAKQSNDVSRGPSVSRLRIQQDMLDARPGFPTNASQGDGLVQPQRRLNRYRESEATLWEPQRPLDSRGPGCKVGPARSATSDTTDTLMPTQEELGNMKWARQPPAGTFAPPGNGSAGHVEVVGQAPTGQKMPNPRYAPSFKSSNTTVFPTQSHIYGDKKM